MTENDVAHKFQLDDDNIVGIIPQSPFLLPHTLTYAFYLDKRQTTFNHSTLM